MLDLSENLLGHDAWGSPSNAALAAIARALPIRPRLASLSLARNDLTSAGVAEFARALPASVGLSRLSLAGNVLGAPAARGIAAALVEARVGSSRDGAAALDLAETMDPILLFETHTHAARTKVPTVAALVVRTPRVESRRCCAGSHRKHGPPSPGSSPGSCSRRHTPD